MVAGPRKAVYFVSIATPAISPAASAPQRLFRSLARKKTAIADKLSARAGTSSIRLKLGRNAGDRTVIHTRGRSTPRANRRNSASRENTKRMLNGKSHSFHRYGRSPKSRMAMAHQYGSTG